MGDAGCFVSLSSFITVKVNFQGLFYLFLLHDDPQITQITQISVNYRGIAVLKVYQSHRLSNVPLSLKSMAIHRVFS